MGQLSPEEWFNLAWKRQHEGRWQEALAAYDQALARGVEQPEEAHLNRAVILAEALARSDDAAREVDAALDLNPRFVPAWVSLGSLHEQRGHRAAARHAYEQALGFDPVELLLEAFGVYRPDPPPPPGLVLRRRSPRWSVNTE